jgi:O6-methylguanine-DNA--protein-cysteine methyltransferase
MQKGAMAGQVRGQEYGEQADIAKARDAISRFNVQQQADVAARNVAAQRQAQMYNAAESQRIAEANVASRNASQQYQNQLSQQQFANQLARTQGATGMQTNVSNVLGQEAAGTRQMYGGIAQGAGQLGAAYISSQPRSRYQKPEDDEDINATE